MIEGSRTAGINLAQCDRRERSNVMVTRGEATVNPMARGDGVVAKIVLVNLGLEKDLGFGN